MWSDDIVKLCWIKVDFPVYSSNPVVAGTTAVLHLKLVFMVLAVKQHVWKMGGGFNVSALKDKAGIDVRMWPEIVRFMQIPQTGLAVCASSTHQTIHHTELSVILPLPHHTISPLPFHIRWKTNIFLKVNH